ncbi:CD99 antigen-like protein 2 isoform X1 [Electrophorus electricus]|uniref:CD99 antigen-like protein 2 isoform X1 n=1 Tax=Electrophorus electricus TaxID=8005 RepID=UPI0015D00B90|nr:CD99 antigen-like protein 2 isoform X1 [Electrophorus electricus]
MRGLSVWTLLAVFSLVAVKGLGQDLSLLDALDDEKATPTPKTKPAGGPGAGKGISDLLEDKSTKKPPVLPKDPVKPKLMPEETHSDLFAATVRLGLLPRTTARPVRTSAPPRKAQDDPGFEHSDALEPNNIDDKGKETSKGGNEFTDDDLLDVGKDDTYKPDKGKGGRGGDGGHLGPADDGEPDTMAETGTIAGIVSAVAMALVGAVSGYISYQKKKLCFSIQQSLNADVVKAENPEAVVAQEPQVQQTLLQPPNAEPPTEGNAV